MEPEERPSVPAGYEWVWRCWHRLHRGDRPYKVSGIAAPMGVMRIVSEPQYLPWDVVRRWCRHHGIGPDGEQVLEYLLLELDSEYIEWWQQQQQVAT